MLSLNPDILQYRFHYYPNADKHLQLHQSKAKWSSDVSENQTSNCKEYHAFLKIYTTLLPLIFLTIYQIT